MAKEDSAIKQWLSNEVRYADLFNALIFDGKQVIMPDTLHKLDGEENVILRNKAKRKNIEVKRFRDIVMSWNNQINLVVLACEAQSYVDYTMPFRVMLYDGLTYNSQKNQMWSELSSDIKKELSPDEILSNYRKTDKLIPTITIIFYYNDKDWDGPIELHDMIDFGDAESKEILKKYISNYHINVFNLNKVDDFSKFKSDLHIIFNMLKYKRNKEELYNYTMENERYFRHISNDSIRALGELLNAKDLFERFIDNKKEEQDMCKALYDLINDSKEEGKESERYKLVSSFINGAKRLGYEEEKIKEALRLDYGLSNDEIEKLL